MRKQIAAANWKMNLTLQEAKNLASSIASQQVNAGMGHLVLVAVPFPYLIPIQEILRSKEGYHVCAQNLASTNNGAYTGEVSASMLQSLSISYALIGHSERREYNHETNEILAEKINRALENGINPVFCCGEPLSVREEEKQNEYVEKQLMDSLSHLNSEQMNGFIIAYEPIWAIGTGKTASSDQAQDMHKTIRNWVANHYNQEIADSVSILYGGSVKSSNASEIFEKPDVDGGLVGGASLIPAEFISIITSLKKA
jgi:triosephosphate isomerase